MYAIHAQNLLLSTMNMGKVPAHTWTGHQYTQYTTTHLHPFGSTAYMDVIRQNGHGVLEAASVRCWMLGWWVDRSRGYRLEDPTTRTLIASRDAQFVKTDMSDTLYAVKGKYTTTTSGLTAVLVDDAPTHMSNSLPPMSTTLAPSISATKVHLGSNPPPALLGTQHMPSEWIGACTPPSSKCDTTACVSGSLPMTTTTLMPSKWTGTCPALLEHGDNLNTTQTLECTKDKYNAKIKSERVSPKVAPTTCIGRRVKGRRCEGDEWIITK
jgi:hypothetical protein